MDSHACIGQTIRAQWRAILRRAGLKGVDVRGLLNALPQTPKILGSSHKVELGERWKILTAVLYLPPAGSGFVFGSLRTLCPWSTPECRRACLTDSGQLAMPVAKLSGRWKLALLKGAPQLFRSLLSAEIELLEKRAKRGGMAAAVRLDGTSDLGMAGYYSVLHPNVQFYDYTKSETRARGADTMSANWAVTFSYSGHNRTEAKRVLSSGGNVAVVYRARPPHGERKGDPLPASWHGWPTVDGDESDIRFQDPPGHVVALSLKGNDKWQDRLANAGVFATPVRGGRRLRVAK